MFKRLLLIAVASMPLGAQSTAVIFGNVVDPSGAALVNAAVTATNEATGVSARVLSNESGDYVFVDLKPGSYKIVCQQTGFQTFEQCRATIFADGSASCSPNYREPTPREPAPPARKRKEG